MRMSIFSVQDHYPTQARTVPELYKQILVQAELVVALLADVVGYLFTQHRDEDRYRLLHLLNVQFDIAEISEFAGVASALAGQQLFDCSERLVETIALFGRIDGVV